MNKFLSIWLRWQKGGRREEEEEEEEEKIGKGLASNFLGREMGTF